MLERWQSWGHDRSKWQKDRGLELCLMTFSLSTLVLILDIKDYILFIKLMVLVAKPGRAGRAEPRLDAAEGCGGGEHTWGSRL